MNISAWVSLVAILSFLVTVIGFGIVLWNQIRKLGDGFDTRLDRLEIKIDEVKAELKADIKEVRAELKSDIQRVETELKADIQRIETELKADIKEVERKVDRNNYRIDVLYQRTPTPASREPELSVI